MTEPTTPDEEQQKVADYDANLPTPDHADDNQNDDQWAPAGVRGEDVGETRPKE